MKYSIAEVFGLAFILQQVAAGNTRVLPYTKFSKSATGQKNVAIIESVKQSNAGPSRQITIFVGCNGKKHSLNLSPAEAYSLAKQLDLSATEATKLEFSRLSSTPNISRVRTEIQQGEPAAPFHMPPIQQQQPPQMSVNTPIQQPLAQPMQPTVHTPNAPMQQSPAQHKSVNNVVDQFSNILNSQN